MLARLLRECLFFLVHLFISLLENIQYVYHRFWVRKHAISQKEVTNQDIKLLLEHVPKLTKKLKHLVMLADTNHHSMSDLANLVIWSLVAGIPYVSFHDITGNLKANEEKLFFEVERKKKGVPGCIKWSNKHNLNGYSNGMQTHTVIVNIFTSKDGRLKIAECIQKIVENEIPSKRENGEFTAQEFSEALAHVYPKFPDPELALYTGDVCCTHGCLPWQIRLTEFIQISSNHSVNVEHYLNALNKYNKCDQRFVRSRYCSYIVKETRQQKSWLKSYPLPLRRLHHVLKMQWCDRTANEVADFGHKRIKLT